jgi:hypothetical protein
VAPGAARARRETARQSRDFMGVWPADEGLAARGWAEVCRNPTENKVCFPTLAFRAWLSRFDPRRTLTAPPASKATLRCAHRPARQTPRAAPLSCQPAGQAVPGCRRQPRLRLQQRVVQREAFSRPRTRSPHPGRADGPASPILTWRARKFPRGKAEAGREPGPSRTPAPQRWKSGVLISW